MRLKVKLKSKKRQASKLSATHCISYLIVMVCQYNMFSIWKQHDGPGFVHRELFGIPQRIKQINYCSSRFNTANLSHPHLGARDKSGRLGCVVNLDFLMERMEELPAIDSSNTSICTPNDASGIEGEGGNLVLKKIRKGLDQMRQENNVAEGKVPQLQATTSANNKTTPRILCMVYTVHTESNPHTSLRAITRTWAKRCDGFFAASNFTDPTIGAIDLPHFGEESYTNMWQKVRTMWSYAYDHYRDKYDYFYICGDDTYVIADNLRAFVQDSRIEELEDGFLDAISSLPQYRARALHTSSLRPRPLIWGDPMIHKRFPVIAGGGGYILNRAAIDFWGTKGMDTFYAESIDSREDIMMSSFFWDNGLSVSETVDVLGGHRFTESAEWIHGFDGYSAPTSPKYMKEFLDMVYNKGIEYASDTHVSFHLKIDIERLQQTGHTVADLIQRYHALLYRLCG
ncbi:unnamed protein product [Cylindrotheca closterium]|uniref:Hexosyltransferase n=1 Tax=Cylindrotheca closterium TaxID=2856 RepID=A0AAD2FU04_9STRA|nr:unnamed protein product [Cylindrotheca closterium]